jgi:hypothetical protein
MTLPAFAADTSLYEPTGHYRGITADARGSYPVSPAQHLARGIGAYRVRGAVQSPGSLLRGQLPLHHYGKPCPSRGCNCWLCEAPPLPRVSAVAG